MLKNASLADCCGVVGGLALFAPSVFWGATTSIVARRTLAAGVSRAARGDAARVARSKPDGCRAVI